LLFIGFRKLYSNMRKALAIAVILLYANFTFACSTFLLNKNGQLVFGRNYDWVSGNGTVMVNAKNVKKTSFAAPGEKTITWVSSCGSITFNQFGKEFPHGGMNEKGLVVELMWQSGTIYPHGDERPSLNELQWIQYQLDNCATVDEVLATDSVVRISRAGAVPLHYLVADASGNAATIEFVNGKMVVHKGPDLKYPVLTNTFYEEALRKSGKKNAKPFDNSVERFDIACRLTQQFQTSDVKQSPMEYAFYVLNQISQGSYTKWSIVYDISNQQIHFIANGSKRQHLAFSDFDFSCSENRLAYNLQHKNKGAIRGYFKSLNFDQNKQLIERSAFESRSQVQIPELALSGAAQYYSSIQCLK